MIRRPRRRGFSILELVVVLATISVLASIAIPNLTSSFKRARSIEALQTMGSLERAMVEYYNRNGEYPRSAGALNPVIVGVDNYAKQRMTTTLPGWSEIGFKADAEYRYRYQFTPDIDASTGKAVGVLIEAFGDTDADGNVGTFTRILRDGFNITPPLIDLPD